MSMGIQLAEQGKLPDAAVRLGIRRLLARRLQEISAPNPAIARQQFLEFVQTLRRTPIAIETAKANEQHYEVPTEFFLHALGHRRKYSSCYFGPGVESLDEAEDAMLKLSCERAQLQDGQRILELGCGWGSLTLWMAEHYPNSRITGVSNSRTQREFIMGECQRRGFQNVEIITCDVNELALDGPFDRVVSIEMFEHVRNYQQLLSRIANWLAPDGLMFVHIFCHGTTPYPFEIDGDDNWMGKYFFTGGIMPSDDLFYYFQDDLVIDAHWRVSGRHYQKTARCWLENMDARKDKILPILAKAYGPGQAEVWFERWRIFFMACEELWGYHGGKEWWVSHYLWRKR